MNEAAGAPSQASVLYLRLADFAGRPVVEQARLRAQLEAVAATGLTVLREADRVVVEAPDGLAIVVLGDAVGALTAAERCLDAAAVLPLCIGAGHGAVATVDGHGAVQGLLGDGLHSAAVAAGFAAPAQLLATHAFREAVAQQSPARQAELPRSGSYSDASVRTHELFVMDRSARARRRRRLAVAGAAGLVALLACGYVGRLAYRAEGPFAPPAEVLLAISPSGEVFVDGEARGPSPPLAHLSLRAGRHRLEVRHGDDPPLALELDLKPGEQRTVTHVFTPLPVVVLDVSPGGEVLVDGESRGRLPAAQRLELREGRHTIEVRYGPYPPFRRSVELTRGQQVTLRHVFAPAVVAFKVKPGGQVYVDGVARGALPTLKQIELAPGRYVIEVHHGRHPPHRRTVELKAGQRLVVQHTFKESFFRRLLGGDR